MTDTNLYRIAFKKWLRRQPLNDQEQALLDAHVTEHPPLTEDELAHIEELADELGSADGGATDGGHA